MTHPRDRFITVFGRKPVLEVLADPAVQVDKVLLSRKARGPEVDSIVRLARKGSVELRKVDIQQVNRLSKSAKQDQGVAADVVAPRMGAVEDWLASGQSRGARAVLALVGVTTPANVGIAIRSAMGAGVDGILMPRHGTAKLSPMVLKASAGHAFRAPILRCQRAEEGLAAMKERGFSLVGLTSGGGKDLFAWRRPKRVVLVLGNESTGLTPEVDAMLDERVRIPMAEGVESLNVACAATLVCYEVMKR